MAGTPREVAGKEAQWVLDQIPEAFDPEEVTVTAMTRDDGLAWYWVYPRDVAIGDVYTTWVVERTVNGSGTISNFKSRRAAQGDVTVP